MSGILTRLSAAAARTSSLDESRKRQHTGPSGSPPASPSPSSPSDTDMSGPGQIAQSVLELLTPQLAGIKASVAGINASIDEVKHSNALLLDEIAGVKKDNAALKEEQAGFKLAQARMESRIEEISNKYLETKNELETLQRIQRSPNAIIFGAPEEISGAVPMDTVKTAFIELPNGPGDVPDPIACVRLGMPRTGPDARPRPIKITFPSVDAKHAALRRGKDLRAEGFNIDVDLTPAQQRERSLKQPRYTALKTQQLSNFWRGSRLMYRSQDGQVRKDLGPRPPTTRPATDNPGPSYSQAAAPSSSRARA